MVAPSSLPSWLEPNLARAAALMNDAAPVAVAPEQPLYLGIDLGTSDVVTMAVDARGTPVAVCLEWADVVRDGVVLAFFEAVQIVKAQVAAIEAKLGRRFTHAATSFPPGTDPRISANVIEAAGLQVSAIIDEPSAVATLLGIKRGAVVDIGGGTTGVALIEDGKVVYSGDEATGGHHVTLTLAGALRVSIEDAEKFKIERGHDAWGITRPVFEKMTDIVHYHLRGHVPVDVLYLSGGSCALPGVRELFADNFPGVEVVLPQPCLFLTPLAIAASGRAGA
ncbi:MAG: ethanolamine utilization protein EutJ [Propionivibrio sp.]